MAEKQLHPQPNAKAKSPPSKERFREYNQDVEALFRAIRRSDVLVIRRLASLPNFHRILNATNNSGATALQTACIRLNEKMVQVLIEYHDIDLGNIDRLRTLHDVCALHPWDYFDREKQLKIAGMLLAKRPDLVNQRNRLGRRPLHVACANSDLVLIRLLLKRGANALEQDRGGQTPLHTACDEPYRPDRYPYHIIECILNHTPEAMTAALLLKRDNNGRIALHYTPRGAQTKLLLEYPFSSSKTSWISYEMFFAKNNDNEIPMDVDWEDYEPSPSALGTTSSKSYLESFLLEPLTVPAGYAKRDPSDPKQKKRRFVRNDQACVKLNPDLDTFQRTLAEQAFLLMRLKVPLNELVYEILGYLTPIDVLKRTKPMADA